MKHLVNSQCLGLPPTMFPVGLGKEAQYHCQQASFQAYFLEVTVKSTCKRLFQKGGVAGYKGQERA